MYFSIISLTENTENLLINQNQKNILKNLKKVLIYLNNSNNIIENIEVRSKNIFNWISCKVDRAAMHNG